MLIILLTFSTCSLIVGIYAVQNANVSISGDISYERPIVPLDFIFEETSSSEGKVVDYIGTDTDIVIPESYSIAIVDGEEVFIEGDDYTVTAIDDGTSSSTGVFYGDNLTSVVFPVTIEKIGDYAFYWNTRLRSFNLGELGSLTEIGSDAFRQCSSLGSSISLPSSLEIIGASAFYNCTSLTGNLTIPAGVETIEASTFYYCSNLSSVTIGENVRSIGSSAFRYCGASEVTISQSVTNISNYAFADMDNLSDLYFNARNANNLTSTSHVFRSSGADSGIEVTFGSSVTRVPAYLFYGSSTSYAPRVETVTLSTSITTLGNNAFYNNIYISEININSRSLSNLTASSNVFYNAGNETNSTGITVTFGSSVTRVPAYLFYGSSTSYAPRVNIVTFSSSITTLGTSAFYNNTYISELNINSRSLSNLTASSNVFYNAGNRTNSPGITVTFGEGVNQVPNYLFYVSSESYVPNIVSVELSSTITDIGNHSFYNSVNLEEITYGCANVEDMTSDDSETIFYNAGSSSGAVNLEFTNTVNYIPAYLFNVNDTDTAPRITTLTIGENVEDIGDYAFYNCYYLTQINYNARNMNDLGQYNSIFSTVGRNSQNVNLDIGDTVSYIPSYLFYALTYAMAPYITTITVGENVEDIGNYAFYYCYYVTQINFNATQMNDLIAANQIFSYVGVGGNGITVNFAENVERVAGYLFSPASGSPNIITISMGDSSVEEIGDYAFSNLDNVTSLTLSDSLQIVGDSAFYACSELTTLTIPASVTTFGSNSFAYMRNLSTINYNATAANDVSSSTNVFGRAGSLQDAMAFIVGNDVTYIPAYLCYGTSASAAPRIKGLTIGTNVRDIGNYAFYYCGYITGINYRATNMTTSFGSGNYIFARIGNSGSGVTVYFLSGVTRVPAYMFYSTSSTTYASNIEYLSFSSSVTTIGSYAFRGCTSISSLSLPSSVRTINTYSFYGCSGFSSLTIPSTARTMGSYSFANCSGLTRLTINANLNNFTSSSNIFSNSGTNGFSVTFGSSVTRVPSYLFYGSSGSGNVSSVTFGDNVETIGSYSFRGTDITSLLIPNTISSIETYAFYGADSLSTITIEEPEPNAWGAAGTLHFEIQGYAFNSCNALTSVSSSGNTYVDISGYTFANCTNLQTFSPYITCAEVCAFLECIYLSSVSITYITEYPENRPYSIGQQAFDGCNALNNVYFVGDEWTMPSGEWTISPNDHTPVGTYRSISVSNSRTAATYLTSTYVYRFWRYGNDGDLVTGAG